MSEMIEKVEVNVMSEGSEAKLVFEIDKDWDTIGIRLNDKLICVSDWYGNFKECFERMLKIWRKE